MSNHGRLEQLLIVQQSLRAQDPKANRHHLFEIERALDEITSGESNSHTATVERWCSLYLAGAA